MITESQAWAKCPCPDKCKSVMEHPCLVCWDDAGDIVAGLRLGEVEEMADKKNTITCSLCQGTGKNIVLDAILVDWTVVNPRESVCIKCKGTGKVEDEEKP